MLLVTSISRERAVMALFRGICTDSQWRLVRDVLDFPV